MKRVAVFLLVLMMCIGLCSMTVLADNIDVDGYTTAQISVTYYQSEARSMLELVNELRTGDNAWDWNASNTEKKYYELDEYVYDYDLEQLAMLRAAEIALYYDHYRPNGSLYAYAYTQTGYGSYRSCAENIAYGYDTAEEAFNAWAEENYYYSGQGHRRNMLDGTCTNIAIACVEYNGVKYWVMEICKPASSTHNTTSPTVATDTAENVSIELLNSYITSIYSLTASAGDSVTVVEGDSTSISTEITASIGFNYYKKTVTLTADWSSDDESIATVSDTGTEITGVAAGTTSLTTTLRYNNSGEWGSEDITINVTVTHGTAILTPGEDATCEDDGTKAYYTCSVCGDTFEDEAMTVPISTDDLVIFATGHSYEAVVTDPTCTEDGYTTYTCSVCGDSYTADETESTGHTEAEAVTENEVAATCTEDGSYDTVVYCTVCDEELSRETVTVSATGHTYVAVVTDPTCTEGGYTTYTCSTCGDSYTGDETEATGHTEGETVKENVVAATCTVDGSYDSVVYCTVCGEELSRNSVTVSATGHSYVAVVTDPTCTEGGYTTYTCSACDDSYVADETEATGHTWDEGVETKAATCTEEGVKTYTCTVCGETKEEAIATIAHTVVTDEAVAATCTSTGLTEGSHCSVCNTVLVAQEEIPMIDHTVVTLAAVEATCYSTGLTEGSYCSVCNTVLVAQEVIPTIDHTWDSGTVTVAPGCETTGTKTYICAVCGATKTETIDSIGHDYVGVETTAATCEEDGVMTYTCANCSASYTEPIPATDHAWDEGVVTTEASCSGAGVILYTCKNDGCGETYTVAINATEHTVEIDEAVEATCYSTGLTEGSHCSVCGAIIVAQEEIPMTAHSYDSGVTTKAATCTTDGEITYTCSVCNDSYTNTIPASHTNVMTDAYVAPTCTETGLTEGSHCEECGEVILAQTVIEATGHVPVTDAAVAATCTTTGLTEGSHCSVCNEVLTAQEVIPATGHSATKVEAVAATEATDGNIEYWYCADCDTYFSDEALTNEITKEDTIIDALGVTEPDNTDTPSGTETPAPTTDNTSTDISTDGTEATATPAPTNEAKATATPTSEAGTIVTVTPVATATATTGTNNVKTGDNSMIGLWLTIISLAAAGLAGIAVVQKKNRKSVK